MEHKRYKRYKNILEKFLDSNGGKRFFNIVYSVGAAIVILGAMFKILHLPLGNLMLMIGMITEAIVFLLSAFEKPDKEYKWEEVYPVLADNENFTPRAERQNTTSQQKINQQVKSVDNSVVENTKNSNNINPTSNSNTPKGNGGYQGGNFSSGNGFGNGSHNVVGTNSNNFANVPPNNSASNNGNNVYAGYTGSGTTVVIDGSNMTEASEKYADQLTKMSDNMSKFTEVTNSLSTISDSLLQSFQTIIDNSNGIGTNTQGYINQMEALNRNIAGLNTIYEIQLKGVSGQINTIEEINAGLDRMKKLYSGSLADSSLFKNETEKMAKQLSELNVVYARLLQAMTSNMNMGGNAGFNPNNNTQP